MFSRVKSVCLSPQALAAGACFLVAVVVTANVQTAGDGQWYWYATVLLAGKKLYSDLHAVLQPLFVLETAAFIKLLGRSWIASKVPALIHASFLALGIRLVVRHSHWPALNQAGVIAGTFFLWIFFGGFRFDDYHALTGCFVVYSTLSLLSLEGCSDSRRALRLAAGLGLLCGLAITTRLNDGLLLFLTVAFLIPFLSRASRLACMCVSTAVAAGVIVLVVSLTGDSFRDYINNTVFHAAGSKGGMGALVLYPILLPLRALRYLFIERETELCLLGLLGLAASWPLLIRRIRWPGTLGWIAKGAVWAIPALGFRTGRCAA